MSATDWAAIRIKAGRCPSCEAARINGVFCHEAGCPDSHLFTVRECKECGCDFTPEDQHDYICHDCLYPDRVGSDGAGFDIWSNAENQ